MISEGALEKLEFRKMVALLRGYIVSPLGHQALERLQPLEDREAIARQQALLQALIHEVDQGLRLDFAALPGPLPLEKIRAGALLTPQDLLKVRDFIAAALTLYEALVGTPVQEALLDPVVLRGLYQEIRRSLGPQGEVLDDASPALARIRRARKEAEAEVLRKMEALKRAYDRKGWLREPFVTLKNGRYVLPLKSHVQPRGVVHGFSQSEETLFVEPYEVIEVQNRLKRREEEEREEVQRILRALSDRTHHHALFLEQLSRQLGDLETLYARALYARALGAVLPEIHDGPEFVLEEAYHPLLVQEKGFEGTVPLSLHFREAVLLISGPNAGGKTVALKTLGLAVLAAMAVFPFPARRVRVPLPHNLWALGFQDEQDLLKGESSFTALVREIRELLERVEPGDLVLFDEMLASTDPSEGAALAYALLVELKERGARVVANTHLGPLKELVARTPGMVNASMGYDPATGRPTYRMEIGEMGESHALEIAEHEGLPPSLIQRARETLREFEEGLRLLKIQLAEKERELARQARALAAREQELREEEARRLERARQRAREILSRVEREAEELRRRLRKAAQAERAREAVSLASSVKREVREKVQEQEAFTRPARTLVVGKTYRIKPFGFVAEYVGERQGRHYVRVGKQEMEVPRDAFYEV